RVRMPGRLVAEGNVAELLDDLGLFALVGAHGDSLKELRSLALEQHFNVVRIAVVKMCWNFKGGHLPTPERELNRRFGSGCSARSPARGGQVSGPASRGVRSKLVGERAVRERGVGGEEEPRARVTQGHRSLTSDD